MHEPSIRTTPASWLPLDRQDHNSKLYMKYTAMIVQSLLLSLLAVAISAQEEEMWYQWQTEALVAQCPTDTLPPFRLDDPTVSQRTRGVIMSYSTQVPDPEWVVYDVYAEDCTTEIPTGPTGDANVPIEATLDVSYDDLITISATTRLRLEVNPEGLQEYGSLFYTEMERTGVAPTIVSEGDVTLCVRTALWNGIPNTANAAEVTWLDTIVSFSAELEVSDESFLDFATTEQRNGGRRLRKTIAQQGVRHGETTGSTRQNQGRRLQCESTWGIDVFTCPPGITSNSSAVTLPAEPNNTAIPQNLPLRICIQPNEVTQAAGVTLKDVNGLYYSSPTADGAVQTAVEAFNESPDGKTTKTCGDTLCVVETTLDSIYHGSEVLASGKTIFQPSKETVFNQIVVDFELPIEISSEAVGEGSSPSPAVHSFALPLMGFLIGAMVFVQ